MGVAATPTGRIPGAGSRGSLARHCAKHRERRTENRRCPPTPAGSRLAHPQVMPPLVRTVPIRTQELHYRLQRPVAGADNSDRVPVATPISCSRWGCRHPHVGCSRVRWLRGCGGRGVVRIIGRGTALDTLRLRPAGSKNVAQPQLAPHPVLKDLDSRRHLSAHGDRRGGRYGANAFNPGP